MVVHRAVALPRTTPLQGPRADRGTLERARELDQAHRGLLRGAAGFVLSLRFLTTAVARLRAGTEPTRRRAVSHPPAGIVAATFVGHATVMITTPATRVLTDPLLGNFLFGLRRVKAPGIADADRADVSLVLISHAHRDHLHRASLRRLPRAATIVVPPHCAGLVRRLGFAAVVELGPGQSLTHADVEVTAVPVRHSGVRGFGDYARRGASGYVIASPAATIYFAGDTGYFSGFTEIGRRFRPDVAILPIAGYEPAPFREEHMSPLDAIYAFEDLGARVLIPITHGSFPLSYEPLTAPLAWLRRLAQQRNLVGAGAARVGEANPADAEPHAEPHAEPNAEPHAEPNDSDGRGLAALDHGETCFFRKRAERPAAEPSGRRA
jgi:L-ascorbate metabolism protein UlaG (beta-lactamase superfamily)